LIVKNYLNWRQRKWLDLSYHRDGYFTAMMPHPERVFRNVQMSWTDLDASGGVDAFSPWMRMWRNARQWVG
jgi:phosphoribosylformylglycinamidine synthase